MTDSVVFSIVSQVTLDSADSSPLQAQAASPPVAPGASSVFKSASNSVMACSDLMDDDSDPFGDSHGTLSEADDRALIEKFKAIGYHNAYDQSSNEASGANDDDGLATTNPQHLAGFKNGYRASHDVAYRIGKLLGSSLIHNNKETGEVLVLGQPIVVDPSKSSERLENDLPRPPTCVELAKTIHSALMRLPSTNPMDDQLDSHSSSAYMEADECPVVDPYLSELELQLNQHKS
jgi:hypothetical protein